MPAAIQSKPADGLELGILVEGAISQHKEAVPVKNPTSDKDIATQNLWINARAYHILNAWKLAIKLYTDAKRPDLAAKARAQLNADAVAFKRPPVS